MKRSVGPRREGACARADAREVCNEHVRRLSPRSVERAGRRADSSMTRGHYGWREFYVPERGAGGTTDKFERGSRRSRGPDGREFYVPER